MTALFIILGVLIAGSGIYLLFTPVLTTTYAVYFLMCMFLVYGIIGLVRCISLKRFGVSFVFSIISVILGIFLVFTRGAAFATEIFMIYVVSAWMVVQGIFTIVAAIRLKKEGSGYVWGFTLTIGILAILLGIIGCANPLVISISIGIMIAVSLIEAGVSMIVAAFTK